MNIKGFSLVELLLTLAIVAIIAAYGYQSYQHTRSTIEAKLDRQFILTIPGLLEKAYADSLSYPSHLDFMIEPKNAIYYTPDAYYLLMYQLVSIDQYKLSARLNPDKRETRGIDCAYLELHQNGKLMAFDINGKPLTNQCWR